MGNSFSILLFQFLSFLLKKRIKIHSSSVIDETESTLTVSKSLVTFRSTLFKSLTAGHCIPPNELTHCAKDLWAQKKTHSPCLPETSWP